MKKLISIILSVLMIVSSFSVMSLVSAKETNVVSSGDTYSGTTGDCTWSYDENTGVLNISGNGKMDNYNYEYSTPDELYSTDIPWFKYSSKIKTIEVEDGVKTVGDFAFSECTQLEKVTIPTSVTTVGNKTFFNCTNIKDVYYAGNRRQFEEINNIYNNSAIENATLHFANTKDSGTTGDCTWSFDENTGVLNISGNGEMGVGMPWYDYDSLIKKVIIHDGVTTIGDQSLSGCYNLVSVSIPKSVRKIEGIPFSYCLHLENINVDSNNKDYLSVDGVLYNKDKTKLIRYAPGKKDKSFFVPDTVTNISWCAFEYSANLETVSMNDNVTEMEEQVFSDCTNLSSVKLSNNITVIGENLFSKCENLKNVNIPSKVTEIEDGAFENCKSLSTITIPNSVTSISYSVFSGCTNLVNITMPNNLKSIGGSVFDDTAYYNNKSNWDNQVLYLDKYLVAVDEKISGDCVIKNGTKLICDGAFSNCYELTGATIPNSITVLPSSAFECSGIVNVTIPSSVIKIDVGAFGSCGDLENVYYLGTEDQWKSIDIEMYNDYLLDANIYCNGKLIEKVTSGMTGDCQWNYDKENNTLTISGNGEMGNYYDYTDVPWNKYIEKIKYVSIEDGVTGIGRHCFYHCYRVESVTIPNSVKIIELGAFDECEQLSSINIPDSVTKIETCAFENCKKLSEVNISKYVSEIGDNAFSYCENLKSINVDSKNKYYISIDGNLYDKNVTELKQYSLGKTKDTFTLPKTVEYIPENVVSGCNYLVNVNIPENVEFISDIAFDNCTKLNNINVDNNNKTYSSINGTLYSKDKTELLLYPMGRTEEQFVIPNGVVEIGYSAFSKSYSLCSIVIPQSVTIINDAAFEFISIENVYYTGTKEQWKNMTFGINNEKLQDANITYNYAPTEPTTSTTEPTTVTTSTVTETEPTTVSTTEPSTSTVTETEPTTSTTEPTTTVPEKKNYVVSALLQNVVIDNTEKKIEEGNQYTATLTPEEGYKIESVKVQMGEKEIVVPYTDNKCTIDIPNVDGDIAIIAVAVKKIEPTTEPTTSTTEPTTSTTEPTTSTTEPTTVTTSTVTETEPTTVSTTEPTTSTVTETEPTTVSTTEPTTSTTESTTINTTPSTTPTTTQPTTTKPTVKKVAKVTVNKKSVVLVKGRTTTVKATVSPTNASNKKLKWTTSNSKVAVVNSQGKITAKGRGNATIKVMALDGSNKYATVKVTVKQPVTSVKLNRKSANLKVKGKAKQKTVTLKATVYPKNANNKAVSWKSSNTRIATVNSKGKVTAKKKGTCYIIVTAKDGSKKSAKCKIVVK